MQSFKTPGTEVFRTWLASHYSRAAVGNEPVSPLSLHLYFFLFLPSYASALSFLLAISLLFFAWWVYVFSGIHGYPGWKSRTEGIFHGCPRHQIIFIIHFVKSCLKRLHWIQSQNPSRRPVIVQSPPERGISLLDLFQCSISIRD